MVSATAAALLLGGAPGVSAADPHPAPARGAVGTAADPAPLSILQLIPLQLPLLSVLGGGLPAVGGRPAPSGLVEVMDGDRTLRSYRVRPADNGQLHGLEPGAHRVVTT